MIDSVREIVARIAAVFRKKQSEEELDQELAAHLDLLVDDNLGKGMSPEEANRAAYLAIGGIERAKELHRDARGLPFLETLGQDIRYGLRTLRRDASLTAFAILIVGLGVGASATVFSVFNALLLRPLPFREPDRLAWISNGVGPGLSDQTIQSGHLLDLRAQNTSFEDVAAYFAFYGTGDSKLTGSGEPERLTAVPVSQNFFPLLGVEPLHGRGFTVDECKGGKPTAILLSYGYWQRRFASDRGVVGRALTLNEAPVTVVGIMPEGFNFAGLFTPGRPIDAFLPLPLTPEMNRQGNTLFLIGRLKPGLSMKAAAVELAILSKRIAQQHPERNELNFHSVSLRERVSGSFRPALFALSCAVAALMLLVCANLSNLLLARSTARHKEMAIRAALGAGKGRLVRQMLTESVLLSLGGAALGLMIAFGGTALLKRLDSVGIPLLQEARLDSTALGFALATAVATGLFFGLTPALRTSALSPSADLKEGSRGSSDGRSHGWLRATLVVTEIALACVLLVGAGLLLRSFWRVLDMDPGFRPESAVALRVDPPEGYATREARNAYINEALRLARSVPGVESAGLTDGLPLGRNRSWGVAAKGQVYTRENFPSAFVRIISDGYFGAMGIGLRAGRTFTESDDASGRPVIIINETLARRLWPGEDPLGKIVRTDRPERTVIGVVRDVRHLALEQDAGPEMYLPIRQTGDYSSVDLVVRASRAPGDLLQALRTVLRPLDPDLPANQFRTLQELVDRSVSPRRFVLTLVAVFAGLALILASLGIYAVISYSVNRRKAEIGIRMALGASPGELQRTVVLQTLRLAAIGMLAGTAASWAAAKALSSQLYGITPSDPVTFGAMLAALTTVTALAGYLPARRAARMNPLDALRAE